MAEAKRRLVAILAADVAGYSRLMSVDERATVNTLNAYRQVFKQQIAEHDGRVVDTAGDSVLAVFESVVEAVQCAVEVQSKLENRNRSLSDERRMRFRIGINLGDVIEQGDGTIYGDGVNVAARLQALAEPGGLVISESAHLQVEGKLPFGIVDVGSHDVKNIARPIRVFCVEVGMSTAEHREEAARKSENLSVAALPLDNLTGDPEQEFFVDGLTEQIIADLARSKDLDVVARNLTFRFKGQSVDIRQIGKDLHANYVLEGSVRKAGDVIRVTVQLLDAMNGNHIWAESFDRNLSKSSAFDIHDDISKRVSSAISPPFGILAHLAFGKVRGQTIKENDLNSLLHTTNAYYRNLAPADHLKCRVVLENAAERHQGDATVWALLSYVYSDEHWFGHNELPNSVGRALEAARRAVELDPNSDRTRMAICRASFHDGDPGAVKAEAERVLRLAPNNGTRLAQAGMWLSWAGDWDRGVGLIERGYDIDASMPRWFRLPIILNHYGNRDYELAVKELERFDMPRFWVPYAISAAAYGQLGQLLDAGKAIERLRALSEQFPTNANLRLQRLVPPQGLAAQLLNGLRKAGLDIPDKPAKSN